MSLTLHPNDAREHSDGEGVCRWTFQGGQNYAEGVTSEEWAKEPEILKTTAGYNLWRDIDNKPLWRKEFGRLIKCGVHNLLIGLDREHRYPEMNQVTHQITERFPLSTGNFGQKVGRQFLIYIILARPSSYKFNYIPHRADSKHAVAMSVSGSQGSSPFRKESKYYTAHTFKMGQKNASKVDNKARR